MSLQIVLLFPTEVFLLSQIPRSSWISLALAMLASTLSMKWTKNIAQFSLSASSFRTEDGRGSDREDVVMVDMLIKVVEEKSQQRALLTV